MYRRILGLGLAAAVAGSLVAQEQVAPVAVGEVFPAGTYDNFNEGAGGAATIDLSRVIGKRPVVLYYWIAGNRLSEQVFTELQSVAGDIGPARLALYGVVTERPGLGRQQIVERIRALKIHVPVINDEGFRIGQRLGVRNVPSISILDAEGRLRLSNGGSLRQPLEYKMDLEIAVRRVADTGTLGNYGSLPRWYPVEELVGQKCPDFQAPILGNGETRSLSQMLASDKVNVLMFWSVDCSHCRKSLPELNAWLKQDGNREGLNVVSAAHIDNQAISDRTRKFCEDNGFVFPTFVDQDRAIGDRFMVVSTPTYVIVGPDGVVDSVVTSGTGVEEKLTRKKRELLGS